MTGGSTFFHSPHAMLTEWSSERFGNDLDSFKQFCTKRFGDPYGMAEAAFSFPSRLTFRLPSYTGLEMRNFRLVAGEKNSAKHDPVSMSSLDRR